MFATTSTTTTTALVARVVDTTHDDSAEHHGMGSGPGCGRPDLCTYVTIGLEDDEVSRLGSLPKLSLPSRHDDSLMCMSHPTPYGDCGCNILLHIDCLAHI